MYVCVDGLLESTQRDIIDMLHPVAHVALEKYKIQIVTAYT